MEMLRPNYELTVQVSNRAAGSSLAVYDFSNSIRKRARLLGALEINWRPSGRLAKHSERARDRNSGTVRDPKNPRPNVFPPELRFRFLTSLGSFLVNCNETKASGVTVFRSFPLRHREATRTTLYRCVSALRSFGKRIPST